MRSVLLWLAMAGFGPVASASDGLLLLPPGPILADGETVTRIQVWGPMIGPDSKVKAKGSGLKVVEISAAPGLLTLSLTASEQTAPANASLHVSVKGAGGEAEADLGLSLVPPPDQPLPLSFEPALARAGVDASVLVRVRVPPGPQAAASRRLLLTASVGTVDAVTPSADGSFVARWTPPPKPDRSRIVVFTAADAAAPDTAVGVGLLPLVVKRSVTVDAPAGSSNLLVLGDRSYGPVPASPAGTVAFDVEVNPTAPSATLRSTIQGATTDKPVDLAYGEAPAWSFLPLPAVALADPSTPFLVGLAVVGADGGPWKGSLPSLTANQGQIGPVTAGELAGVYRALYTPSPAPGPVTFAAKLDSMELSRTVALAARLPTLSVTTTPTSLEPGKKEVVITALLKDANGTSVPGAPPDILVDGLEKVGKPIDNKDGTYRLNTKVKASAGQALVLAEPNMKASAEGPARLVAWTADASVEPGHVDYLVVAAVDRFGNPIANLPLSFSVPVGDGSLSPSGKTDGKGLAWVAYTAGSRLGPVTLRVQGAGLQDELALFQGAAPAGLLPPDALEARWRAAVGLAVLDGPKAAVPVAVAAPAGSPSTSAAAAPVASAAPVTSAAPAAAAAATSTTKVKAPKAPRAASSGDKAPTRLMLGLATMPRTFSMTAEDAAGSVPPEASYSSGDLFGGDPFGGAGIDLRAELGFNETWVADVRARLGVESVEAGHDEQSIKSWSGAVGARYRRELTDGVHYYGIGQIHRISAPYFQYGDERKVVVDVHQASKVGLRAGGGLEAAIGPVFAELEATETLVPLPADAHLGLLLGVAVQSNMAVHLGVDLDWLAIRETVDEVDIKLKSKEQVLFLGGTLAFD